MISLGAVHGVKHRDTDTQNIMPSEPVTYRVYRIPMRGYSLALHSEKNTAAQAIIGLTENTAMPQHTLDREKGEYYTRHMHTHTYIYIWQERSLTITLLLESHSTGYEKTKRV